MLPTRAALPGPVRLLLHEDERDDRVEMFRRASLRMTLN
jgi:hypothetical protein